MPFIRDNVDAILDLAAKVHDARFTRICCRMLAGMTPTMIDDALVTAVDHLTEYLVHHRENLALVDSVIDYADSVLSMVGLNGSPGSYHGLSAPEHTDIVPEFRTFQKALIQASRGLGEVV